MSDMPDIEEWWMLVGCNVWWRDATWVACGSAARWNRKTRS